MQGRLQGEGSMTRALEFENLTGKEKEETGAMLKLCINP